MSKKITFKIIWFVNAWSRDMPPTHTHTHTDTCALCARVYVCVPEEWIIHLNFARRGTQEKRRGERIFMTLRVRAMLSVRACV